MSLKSVVSEGIVPLRAWEVASATTLQLYKACQAYNDCWGTREAICVLGMKTTYGDSLLSLK